MCDYLTLNQAAWDARTAVHVESAFYDVPSFLAGQTSLQKIELEQVGEVSGKSLLHLQCHFGMDTLSWARMGAVVTGVDLSSKAIEKARELSEQLNLSDHARFINQDVYTFGEEHTETYDIVFASYGTICWLPDINRWAKTVAGALKLGGELHFVEFHPVYDLVEGYNYFNQTAPDIDEEGTYTENGEHQARHKMATWAHPISDVINAIIQNGLTVEYVKEFDYSPYNCFANMVERAEREFIIEKYGHAIPLTYAIKARK